MHPSSIVRFGLRRASLAAAIKWADDLQDVGRVVAAEYAAGRGAFQPRAHLVALSFAFLWDYAEFVRRWATWARRGPVPFGRGRRFPLRV